MPAEAGDNEGGRSQQETRETAGRQNIQHDFTIVDFKGCRKEHSPLKRSASTEGREVETKIPVDTSNLEGGKRREGRCTIGSPAESG